MKSNRSAARESWGDADAGTSVVVGAILVLAVAATFMVTVAVQWTPIWQANAEAAHALQVDNQMALLQSQTLSYAANRTTGMAMAPIALGPAEASVGMGARLPGGLEFRPAGQRLELSAPKLVLLQANDTNIPVTENQWQSFPGTIQVDDVGSVDSLRLRVADVSRAQNNRKVTMTLTDSTGAFAGSYQLNVSVQSPDLILYQEVRNRNREVVTVVPSGYHQSVSFKPYYANLLSADLAFDQVLASAPKPLRISVAFDPGFNADYAIVFRQHDADGGWVIAGSGGQSRVPYLDRFDAGALRVHVPNTRYPAQTYVLENGALIVEQSGGAVFRVPPAMSVTRFGSKTVLSLEVPSLVGEAKQLSGNQVATVVAHRASSASYAALASNFTLVIHTEFPAVWAGLWEHLLAEADLSNGGTHPEYRITSSASSVRVDVFGKTSDPSSTATDVTVLLRQAWVALSVRT